MAEKRKTALNLLGRFLFETIAVVIGISIAFFVDNWKDERKDRQNEIRLLTALRNDILDEQATLQKNVEALDIYLATYNRMLQKGFSKDSALYEIDRMITYNTYRPVDLTYKEMQQTGLSGLIQNRKLHFKIINLHEKFFTLINESIAIDRQFVLERMIPFMEKHAVYPYDRKVTATLFARKEFKNLLRTNILYKTIDKASLLYYQQYAAAITKDIEQELRTLE